MNKEDTELEIMECYKKNETGPGMHQSNVSLKILQKHVILALVPQVKCCQTKCMTALFYNCSGNATYSLCEIA